MALTTRGQRRRREERESGRERGSKQRIQR